MLQSCFLKIANSQDWVDGFLISQSLWVKQALEHILKPSWFHNSCKQNFCVTKSPKIHLYYQFHIWVTVCKMLSYQLLSIDQRQNSLPRLCCLISSRLIIPWRIVAIWNPNPFTFLKLFRWSWFVVGIVTNIIWSRLYIGISAVGIYDGICIGDIGIVIQKVWRSWWVTSYKMNSNT